MPSSYEIQGRQVTMPVEVRDAASGNVMFLVDAEPARKLLPGDAFEVVEAAPGKTQALLGLIDYRDNDLGDYNEVAIILFVKPRGAGPETAGTFIYKLPVNQSFTQEAGFKIWGFPKTVDEIDMTYRDDSVTGKLVMDGKHVFTLTLPRPSADTAAASDGTSLSTYTYIGGEPHATSMTQGGVTAAVPPGDTFALELGDHPLADELRGLGLEDAAPLICTWNEHMSGVFQAPQKL